MHSTSSFLMLNHENKCSSCMVIHENRTEDADLVAMQSNILLKCPNEDSQCKLGVSINSIHLYILYSFTNYFILSFCFL